MLLASELGRVGPCVLLIQVEVVAAGLHVECGARD